MKHGRITEQGVQLEAEEKLATELNAASDLDPVEWGDWMG